MQLAQASSQLLPSWSPDCFAPRLPVGWPHLYGRARWQRASPRYGRALPRLVARRRVDLLCSRRRAAGRIEGARDAGRSRSRVGPPRGTRSPSPGPDGIHVITLAGAERQVAPTFGEPTVAVVVLRRRRGSPTRSEGASSSSRPTARASRARCAGPYRSVSPVSWAPAGDLLAFTADGKLLGAWLTPTRHTSRARARRRGRSLVRARRRTGNILAYSAPRASCPGHSGIRLYDSAMLTGTCAVIGTAAADVIEGTRVRRRRDPRRCGQRPGCTRTTATPTVSTAARVATPSGQTARIGSRTARSSTDRPLGTVGPWLSHPPRSSMRRS